MPRLDDIQASLKFHRLAGYTGSHDGCCFGSPCLDRHRDDTPGDLGPANLSGLPTNGPTRRIEPVEDLPAAKPVGDLSSDDPPF